MRLLIKPLFLLVMLLAFTSQGVIANTMFCDASSSGTQESTMSMEGHESHSMSMNMTMDQEVSGDMDCCDSDCQCLIGGCSLYVLVPSSLNDIPRSTSYVQAVNSSPMDRSLNSLYRPPIIR